MKYLLWGKYINEYVLLQKENIQNNKMTLHDVNFFYTACFFPILLNSHLLLDPGVVRKPCIMWAQKSTQSPTLMMTMFMEVISMVIPHQCMKPATSTQVRRTHSITNREPRQLPAKHIHVHIHFNDLIMYLMWSGWWQICRQWQSPHSAVAPPRQWHQSPNWCRWGQWQNCHWTIRPKI